MIEHYDIQVLDKLGSWQTLSDEAFSRMGELFGKHRAKSRQWDLSRFLLQIVTNGIGLAVEFGADFVPGIIENSQHRFVCW